MLVLLILEEVLPLVSFSSLALFHHIVFHLDLSIRAHQLSFFKSSIQC